MSDKKFIIIGAAALFWLVSRNQPRRYATTAQAQAAQQNNGLGGLVNAVAGLFRTSYPTQTSTVRPGSNVYGGIRPTQQTINAAANASNADQNPDLNGSPLDWGTPDSVAANPVSEAPWDAAYSMNQYWN